MWEIFVINFAPVFVSCIKNMIYKILNLKQLGLTKDAYTSIAFKPLFIEYTLVSHKTLLSLLNAKFAMDGQIHHEK